jgi:hypothetical protein
MYFLSQKKCIVSVEGEISTPRDIKLGVPWGSVLSLVLYSLYINDTPETPGVLMSCFYCILCELRALSFFSLCLLCVLYILFWTFSLFVLCIAWALCTLQLAYSIQIIFVGGTSFCSQVVFHIIFCSKWYSHISIFKYFGDHSSFWSSIRGLHGDCT